MKSYRTQAITPKNVNKCHRVQLITHTAVVEMYAEDTRLLDTMKDRYISSIIASAISLSKEFKSCWGGKYWVELKQTFLHKGFTPRTASAM